jgi:hypothetical protein
MAGSGNAVKASLVCVSEELGSFNPALIAGAETLMASECYRGLVSDTMSSAVGYCPNLKFPLPM